MKLREVLGRALFCLAVVAPTVWAQNPPGKTDTARFGNPTSTARVFQDYLYGVVKKIDAKARELVLEKTKFGVDQTIKLEPKTRYIHDGKPSSMTHLKAGDQVYVDVRKDKKTGDMIAKKVITGVAPTQLP